MALCLVVNQAQGFFSRFLFQGGSMAKKGSTVDVEFSLGGKAYAYKTDLELRVGDLVYVTVRNSEKKVSVVHAPSLTPQAATASILRKAED
jgi:hypothetical protein